MLRRKYYYDLHVHSERYSDCSRIPAEEVIALAKARGLDGIALTEHDHAWSEEELAQLKQKAGAADFTILIGSEVQTQSEDRQTGDLLVFGARVDLPRPCTIDQVCVETHRRGGIVVAPHPFIRQLGIGEEVHNAPIDAIEVYNYRYREPLALQRAQRAWKESGLAGLGASDAHFPEAIGQYCTSFDTPLHSESDLIDAILGRRCQPLAHGPRRRWIFF